MQIGLHIKDARKELGISRELLAEKIGVSTSTVMRWENGNMQPSFEMVVRLSKQLRKPLDYFSGLGEHGDVLPIKEESLSEQLTQVFTKINKIPASTLDLLVQCDFENEAMKKLLEIHLETHIEDEKKKRVKTSRKA